MWSNVESVVVVSFLPNGDFEQGRGVDWEESSPNGLHLVASSATLPISPRRGDWAAWLGGVDNEFSYIWQHVTIPTSYPGLSFWYWIDSDDNCGYDYGRVTIDLSNFVESFDLCRNENSDEWEQRTVDLSAYAGQTVDLGIVAETDGLLPSALFVDDVVWCEPAR
jgi:hypothetical protein